MKRLLMILFFVPFLAWGQSQTDTNEELKKLAWQNGPTEGAVAGKASLKVPKGYVFLDEQNTKRFLELNGNPPDDRHYLIAPKSLSWFTVFSFNSSGYIKDDEKIDPDDLLKSLKESDCLPLFHLSVHGLNSRSNRWMRKQKHLLRSLALCLVAPLLLFVT